MTLRRIPFLIATLLALGVFVTCTIPTQTKHALHTQGRLHPWLHLVVFGLISLLLVYSLRAPVLRIAAIAALIALGYLTEARESRWDHWPIEQIDVRTDAVGVLLGAAAATALSAAQSLRSRQLATRPSRSTLGRLNGNA